MTKDLKAAFEDWYYPEGDRFRENALAMSNGSYVLMQTYQANKAFQSGAKHILELVESQGMQNIVARALADTEGWDWDGKDEDWRESATARAFDLQKAIADEIRKGM